MIAACLILAGAVAQPLPDPTFTLSWVHSVEKVEWRESWRATADGLVAVEARVKGSGAGMDPPDGAVLRDGWWVWRPDLPILPELVLAVSGATVGGWTLCSGGQCQEIGVSAGEPIRIRPCG